MTEPKLPPGYVEDCKRLLSAALSFLSVTKEPVVFHFPNWLIDPRVMPVGDLRLIEQWAADEHTRNFVAHLERETDRQCTIMQFKSVVMPLFLRAQQGGKA